VEQVEMALRVMQEQVALVQLEEPVAVTLNQGLLVEVEMEVQEVLVVVEVTVI